MFPPMNQTTERARMQNETRELTEKAARAAQNRRPGLSLFRRIMLSLKPRNVRPAQQPTVRKQVSRA